MKQTAWSLSLLLFAGGTACTLDLGAVPPEAQITCAADDQCPTGFSCNTAAGRCVAAGVDPTPPALEVGSVALEYPVPSGCPLPEVAAVGAKGHALLSFRVGKPLAKDPLVVGRRGSDSFAVTGSRQAGLLVRALIPAPAGLADGGYRLWATLSDAAFNEVEVDLGVDLQVATATPPPVTAAALEKVVLRRAPWGSAAGQTGCRLSGEAAALPPGVWAVALDRSAGDAVLGAAPVQADGSFAVQLSGCEGDAVSLAAIDAACSGALAAALPVRRVELVVRAREALAEATPAARLEGREWFLDVLEQSTATRPLALGAAGATTAGAASWRQERITAPPAGRWSPAFGFDRARGRAVLYGGWVDGGWCAPGMTECRDVLEWDGLSWTRAQATDLEGDGEPVDSHNLLSGAFAFDPVRRLFLHLERGTATDWAWAGHSWRRLSDAEDRPGRYSRAVGTSATPVGLAFDRKRARTLLAVDELRPARGAARCPNGAPPSDYFDGSGELYCEVTDLWSWSGSWELLDTPSTADFPALGFDEKSFDFTAVVRDESRDVLVLTANSHARYVGPASSAGKCAAGNVEHRDGCFEVVQGLFTWEWDGASWAKVQSNTDSASTAAPFHLRCASYDEGRELLVAVDDRTPAKVWSWDGTGWSGTAAADPEGDGNPMGCAGLTSDPVRGVQLLVEKLDWPVGVGARCESGVPADLLGRCSSMATWAWNGVSWRRLDRSDPHGVASPTLSEGIAWDPGDSTLVSVETLALDPDAANRCADGAPADAYGACNFSIPWRWDGRSWSRGAPSAANRLVGDQGVVGLVGAQALGAVYRFDKVPEPPVDGLCRDGLPVDEFLTDCWSVKVSRLDGPGWAPVAAADGPDGSPCDRWFQQPYLYEPVLGGIVLLEPYLDANYDTHSKLWLFDGAGWKLLVPPTGSTPAGVRLAFDPRTQSLVTLDSLRAEPLPDGACPAGSWRTGAGGCGTPVLFRRQGGEWVATPFGSGDVLGVEGLLLGVPGREATVLYDEFGALWELEDGPRWRRVAVTDVEGDQNPPPASILASSATGGFCALNGKDGSAQVLLGGGLWSLDYGAQARPGQAFHLALAGAGVGPTASLERVAVSWSVGAVGLVDGEDSTGTTLRVWDAGRWVKAGENTAAPGGPAVLAWSSSDPEQVRRLAVGEGRELAFSVVPRAANGAGPRFAAVTSGEIELTVSYRVP